MRYDPSTDKYVPCRWEDAFAEIGRELKGLDPKSVIFYASGRASLETSYMYSLLARMYGCNNLPDSSNMCHESTSVGLKQALGAPVGTVKLEDFQDTDCILFFGQNVGSNSPRMLHELQPCARRGVPIITFNPLRERGLEEFTNPQSPLQMVTGSSTSISTQYYQLRAGSDTAAMTGMCKYLIERDDAAIAERRPAYPRSCVHRRLYVRDLKSLRRSVGPRIGPRSKPRHRFLAPTSKPPPRPTLKQRP